MRAVTTAVLVLAVAPFLKACPAPLVGCEREEAPEFTVTEEQITRNDVVAVLGEPIETIKSEDRRVDVYEYDGHCSGLVWLLPIPYPLPIFRETDQMLTVEYGPDGSFLTAQVWPDAETPEEVIELYERLAERRVACNLPVSEAIQLDVTTQWELSHLCREFGDEVPPKWRCLAAHGGQAEAQFSLGGRYEYGDGEIQPDTALSYLWHSLAARNGKTIATRAVDRLRADMSPTQITEAERLVAEWEPNPAECETIGAQFEN